jgi:hypothetical protein
LTFLKQAIMPFGNPYQSPTASAGSDSIEPERTPRPLWVRFGLLGVPSRRAALVYFWASLFTSAGCMLGGYFDPRLIVGVPLVFAASWYWACIRWVDLHDQW